MNKLLRASFFTVALFLTATAGFLSYPHISFAKGTAEVEAVILKDKVVPATEVTRIGNDTDLCSPDVAGGGSFLCEETYPGKTRVTMTGSKAGWVITIRDSTNKVITQETDTGGTGTVRDSNEDLVTARDSTTGTGAGGCGMANLDQCILNIPGYIFSALGFLLLTLSSIILGIAGTVFNWVVIRTVFQFALYFGTSAGMLVAWGVLRDIANIALLFTFIFVGIATILNTSSVEGYTAKKALPQLIIFAVLLNFSLFATQAVIDVANGFSSVFATYAGQDKECNQATSSTAGGGQELAACANLGISSKILEAAGMHQIFPHGDQAGELFKQAAGAPYSYTVMLILLSLMVTVTAMVLLAAAIMLIIRVVVLSLLMVTSPIGFAGMAIPALHPIAKDWWHKLINQAFFAPLFLLMVFVSLKLVEGLQSGQASIADAMLGNTGIAGQTAAGNMQVVVVFMIVIGFMIGALMVAQKMGAYGAGFATNAASAVVFGALTRGTNVIAGGASRAARIGIQKTGLGNTGIGKVAVNRVFRPIENANLDLRRTPVSAILKAGGVTAGAKTAEHATFGDIRHQVIDRMDGKESRELEATYKAERATLNLEDNAHHSTDGSLSADDAKHLQNMSSKQLEELHGIKTGVEALAQNLKQSQYDDLMKGDKLSPAEKSALKEARDKRFDSTQVNIAAPGQPRQMVDRAQRTLSGMKPQDVAALDGALLTKKDAAGNLIVMRNLKASQLAAIDPDKLSISELAEIKNYIQANQAHPEVQAFHTIVGRGPVGPGGVGTRGTNPNASRRWAGNLP